MKSIVARFSCFWVGLFVGAVVIFIIMETMELHLWKFGKSKEAVNGSRVFESLKLVIVVARHGNRGGFIDYSLDPYPLNDTNFWPYGASGLTPYGRIQSYKLGVKLRSFYNGFLPTTFKSDDIYANSDRVERAVMSGELVLAGLYPPQGWQIWNPTINWQPIALYTNSSDRSSVIETCRRFSEEAEVTYNECLEENAAIITEITSTITNFTGVNTTSSSLIDFFDKLKSEDTEGFSLPKWTETIYPEPFTALNGELFFASYAGSEVMVRLIVGELFDEFVQNLYRKSLGILAPDRKMLIFSAHDSTVVPLQIALGVDRSSVIKSVKPGSALIVELHQDLDTSKFYVKVLYVDGPFPGSDPVPLILPHCGNPCYLDDFVNSTLRFTNVRFEEECRSSKITSSRQDQNSDLIMYIG